MEKIIAKKEKKTKLEVIANLVLMTLIIILIFVTISCFLKTLVVTSGSMSPTFKPGDLIFVTKIDSKDVKPGQIITFRTADGAILTHRVVEIKADGEIITKGDANKTNDSWPNGWKLKKATVKYLFSIPKLGYIKSWISGPFKGQTTGAYYTDTETVTGNTLQAQN
jgi:signal peptidase